MSPQEQGGVATVKINGVTRGGVRWVSCPPLESLREILELKGKREVRGEKRMISREKRGKERRKNGKWKTERKRREIVKWGGGKLKMERGKWAKDLFFFFFLFFFNLFIYLFIFFLAFHFLNPPKFVWGVPKWIFFGGGGVLTLPTWLCPWLKWNYFVAFTVRHNRSWGLYHFFFSGTYCTGLHVFSHWSLCVLTAHYPRGTQFPINVSSGTRRSRSSNEIVLWNLIAFASLYFSFYPD